MSRVSAEPATCTAASCTVLRVVGRSELRPSRTLRSKPDMPEVEPIDALIIGTGQAGNPLAGVLAEARWKTAIIEKDRVGGTCMIRGCTPTKTMVASARVAYFASRAADYGVKMGDVSLGLGVVRQRKRAIVESCSAGNQKGLELHETLESSLWRSRSSQLGGVPAAHSSPSDRAPASPSGALRTGRAVSCEIRLLGDAV
jgi:hypothetical protein